MFALPVLLSLPACSEDEELPAPPQTDETADDDELSPVEFWAQPHTVFLGLKGQVSSLTETLYSDDNGEEEEDEGSSSWTHFNADGLITYYNPTGVAEQRWIGMEMNSYTYLYDEQNHLQQAYLNTLGEEQTTYTLTYDDTDKRYVPLPFPLGNMDFFMVRGVSSLSSSSPDFTCTLSDNEVTYTLTETFLRGSMETITTYRYAESACFPTECSVTVRYDGEELSLDHTDYEFDENGRLLSCVIRRTEYGELLETETRRYHSTLPLCIQSKEITDCDGELTRYDYAYEAHGWLSSITLTQDGTSATETYEYAGEDHAGNWCEGRFRYSSHVDMAHWDGTVRVVRTLQY